MSVRVKQTVIDKGYKHFKEFSLPLDIDYKSYLAIVGRDALDPITIKRTFKAWKYVTHALRLNYPELSKAPVPKPKSEPKSEPKPEPTPKPAPVPKPAPKASGKPAAKPAVKKD
jgi:hypothetical protein|tara:strand:- start:205 stop:546 length:342 start_codon:yes stop_codon:yes gene_type:complete